MYSASVPFVIGIENDLVEIGFSSRDKDQSSVCSIIFNINTLEVQEISDHALSKGPRWIRR